MSYNQEGVSRLAHSGCLESHPDLRKGNPQRSEDRGYTKENADIQRSAIAATAVIGVCRPSQLGLNLSAEIDVCRLPISRAQVQIASERKTVYAPESQDLVKVILLSQKDDAFLQRQRAAIAGLGNEKPTGAIKPWKIGHNGLLLCKDRVYILSNPAIRAELLQRYHDNLLAGRFGIDKTAALLQRKYHWIKMEDDVQEYVSSCNLCQRTKAHQHKPYRELSSLPLPEGPWQELTMDFITGLPPSKRQGNVYDAILVVVDCFTKMSIYIPCTKRVNSVDLADLVFQYVFSRFGIPKGIVTNWGAVFTSSFWSKLCYHMRIRRRLSTAFYLQTNRQTERQNQALEQYLQLCVNKEQRG